jgi:hypothetical protein
MPSTLSLDAGVVFSQGLVMEAFHWERVGEEAGTRHGISDPQVDRAMARELDDVVGREAQAFLLLLVDADVVGVDLHRQSCE